ncbi:hypothetical protein Pmani_019806 [Petrolisthes manimaculis]|uniref:Uncharacterized protein n=1 Tax=Petrolisthes manimaculis TaxID=1843537 RepID=A0AAE1PJN7_9EUCA|nr:hypothetical protein Pmani_019806 [Petrolisthes manimaculis]
MDSQCIDLIVRTLPDNLKEEGKLLVEASRISEEERLKERGHKFRKHSRHQGQACNEDAGEETLMKWRKKAEEASLPIAVARLVMELWSPKMRSHAEKLILQNAVKEGHLSEHHLKWVYVFGNPSEEDGDDGWVIDTEDHTIVDLIWEKFKIKEHFSQVSSHRAWIQQTYDRLKEHLPTLSPEIIERHDLSKFAFSQAIGYTLKWVHNTYHNIWKTACDLHLFNEPHHPQCWKKEESADSKRTKLELWLKDACDFSSGCPYGVDLTNLDLSTEDLAEPFMLESFVDMVAIEWERKKGQQLDITTRELVYIDDKFLSRYSKKQHQLVSSLIEQVVAADESWKSVSLREREEVLMRTLPKTKHPLFVCMWETQKKNEESRLKRMIKQKETNKEDCQDQEIVLTPEMEEKAYDNTFYIMVSKVVMELWEPSVRKHAEDLIFKRAVQEKLISDHHVRWIMIYDSQTEKCDNTSSEPPLVDNEMLVRLLWVDFNLREHFNQVQCHRHWVKQSYQRLAKFMPELKEEVIERHDLTKFTLVQSTGYTLKWVHDLNYSVWRRSCDMHLNYEPHHPQLWSKKHTPDYKKSCLETWLSAKATTSVDYGVELFSLDLASENMATVFLLESLVDMVAVEWERNKNKKPDLTYTELIYMEERFLARYSDSDKAFLLNLMDVIRKADDQ